MLTTVDGAGATIRAASSRLRRFRHGIHVSRTRTSLVTAVGEGRDEVGAGKELVAVPVALCPSSLAPATSYLPAWNASTKSALLNRPFRSASPTQVFFRSCSHILRSAKSTALSLFRSLVRLLGGFLRRVDGPVAAPSIALRQDRFGVWWPSRRDPIPNDLTKPMRAPLCKRRLPLSQLRRAESSRAGDGEISGSREVPAMRACVQRVTHAQVTVAGQVAGRITRGLLVLLGVAQQDTSDDAKYLADKITSLRIFEDEAGKMNRSLQEVDGAMLVVSQFTLLGDCRRGDGPVSQKPPNRRQPRSCMKHSSGACVSRESP